MAQLLDQVEGPPVCEDCLRGCPRPPGYEACDTTGCYCPDCERTRRAIEADDRPDETLASLARDMEVERRPTAAELKRERFGLNGYPTWSRA